MHAARNRATSGDHFRESASDLHARDPTPLILGRRHRARSADPLRSRTRSTDRLSSTTTITTTTSSSNVTTASNSSIHRCRDWNPDSDRTCDSCPEALGPSHCHCDCSHHHHHQQQQQLHHHHDECHPSNSTQLHHHQRFYHSDFSIHHHHHHHNNNNSHHRHHDHHHHHKDEEDIDQPRRRRRRKQQHQHQHHHNHPDYYASQSSLPNSSSDSASAAAGRSSRAERSGSSSASSSSRTSRGGDTLNLSLCGCGFLGVYHLGVVSCLLKHGPTFLARLDRVAGASAGALAAALLVTSPTLRHVEASTQLVSSVAKKVRRKPLGALTPGCRLTKELARLLDRVLPPDAHVMARGKLHVSVTDVSTKTNAVVSEFESRQDMIEVLVASCHIPVYSGIGYPSVKGKHCCDGGLTNNLVQFSDGRTITVSPFSGQQDIGPKDALHKGTKGCFFNLHNQDMQASLNNIRRVSHAVFPPRSSILQQYFELGHKDASRFLIREGLYEIQMPPEKPMLMYESSV